jgi:hypothetical protein
MFVEVCRFVVDWRLPTRDLDAINADESARGAAMSLLVAGLTSSSDS